MQKDMAAATDALSGRTPGKKLKTAEIHVRRGAKHGYIAKHVMEDADGNPQHKTPEHPIATYQELMQHMKEHMGAEAEEAAGQGEEKG